MSNNRPRENRNARGPWRRQAAGYAAVMLGCCSLLPSIARGLDPGAAVDAKEWRLLIEPTFLRPAMTTPLPGAKKTVLAAAVSTGTELSYLTKAQFSAWHIEWKEFAARAAANATAELRKLTPQFTRNRKEVIQYAELSSTSPLVASTVLSPEFSKLFEDVFGPEVIVAIPNRFQVYIFPSLASQYEQFAPMVIRAYKETAHPVSLEVFKVKADGISTIGTYEEP